MGVKKRGRPFANANKPKELENNGHVVEEDGDDDDNPNNNGSSNKGRNSGSIKTAAGLRRGLHNNDFDGENEEDNTMTAKSANEEEDSGDKEEEDLCFVCGIGGKVLVCEFPGCTKVYHKVQAKKHSYLYFCGAADILQY